jgi:biopolymer transport protein ExbD
MASIDLGGRAGSRKSIDANIPLVPFIDLLLCCVMFLLVTAVWNELAGVDVTQRIPGGASADEVADETLQLMLLVSTRGYEISTTAGDSVRIPFTNDAHDVSALRDKLAVYRNANAALSSLAVTAEDGVMYESLITALDAARAEGFASIAL